MLQFEIIEKHYYQDVFLFSPAITRTALFCNRKTHKRVEEPTRRRTPNDNAVSKPWPYE